MSVKKQIPSLCKLYSFYEEIPEENLDETDVDCFVYHKIFDISQSQHRIVLVSRGSNKKVPTENSLAWLTICAIFSIFLIKLASAQRFPYRNRKLRLDLQSQKTISLLFTITISLNIQIDKFVYHSVLETTILAYFPSKSLNYTAINLFLLILSTLTIVKFIISTRTGITLKTSVK